MSGFAPVVGFVVGFVRFIGISVCNGLHHNLRPVFQPVENLRHKQLFHGYPLRAFDNADFIASKI